MVPEKVRLILEAHGLQALEFEPGSTPTAELAARRLGVATARIAKSLLFKTRGGAHVLVVCPGDKRLSSAVLRRVMGDRASMTGPEETERVTGYRPGGVCPFALDGVEILLDRELGQYETVYPAAGTDATGVPTTLDQLARITGGRIVDFAGEA
jgi:prolyl-tRNA editing enzyme YbaK/EbsC (Cys-tRNA(Pro) deacylase)